MLSYYYNDLPIIKLKNTYSIWFINNNIIMVYLFKSSTDAFMYIPEIKNNTYILLNYNLENQLSSNIILDNNFLKLNDCIQDTKQKINLIKNPEWELFEEKVIDICISSTYFDISINKILSDMFMFLKLHCGDLTQLSNLIGDIKGKFENSKDQEFFMDEIIKNINNELFIFFNIKKSKNIHINKCFQCFGLKKNNERYIVKYIITKPKNNQATELSKLLINEEISNKIKFIKNYI